MSSPSQNSQPSPELARRIDAVCNRFEAAWRRGAPPRLHDFLDGWWGQEKSALLRELVLLGLDYRRDAGLTCRVEDYQAPSPRSTRPGWPTPWRGYLPRQG